MNYASVASRALALIIDAIVLLVISFLVALPFGMATSSGFEIRGGAAFLAFALWFAYFVIMEAVAGGTLGKLLLGLHVVNKDGCAVNWSQAIIRNVLRIVDGLFVYLVGAIFAWSSPAHQRLGDRAAGTVVVHGDVEPSRLAMCKA